MTDADRAMVTPIRGSRFCLTGKMYKLRKYIVEDVEGLGGQVVGKVGPGVILVVGENAQLTTKRRASARTVGVAEIRDFELKHSILHERDAATPICGTCGDRVRRGTSGDCSSCGGMLINNGAEQPPDAPEFDREKADAIRALLTG